MKKISSVIIVAALFTACNENGVSIEGKADSLGKELDTLGNKIEQKAEQVWDSTKEKASDLKDKVEQKWDSAKVNKRNNNTTRKP